MLSKLCGLAVALTVIACVATAHATEPRTDEANAAVDYIRTLQNADGGFPSFGTDSSAGSTIDAVFALVAAGVDPDTVTAEGGHSPVDYLETQAATYSAEAGALAKLILCVRLLGGDVTSFGGGNLLGAIDDYFDDGTGTFGDDNFDQALFILSAETFEANPIATRPGAAAQRLKSLQQVDGGWEFAAGQGSDSNTTAMVLQALVGREWGVDDAAVIEGGVQYLHGLQNADGGFGYLTGADTDPNSTALVIQALVATGEDIDEGGPWHRDGHTPLDALLSFYNDGTGALQFAETDSPYATYQAVPALMLAPFPDLETRVDEEPAPEGTPTAVPDFPPSQATSTPSLVLPPTGTGPDGSSPWLVLLVGVSVAAVGACAVVGATVKRYR